MVAGVAALVLLVTYPDQLTNILFSQDGALKGIFRISLYRNFGW